MMRSGKLIFTLLILLTALSSPAHTLQPTETIRWAIEESVRVLKDSGFQGGSISEIQQKKLWEIIRKSFDTTEIAKRVLATNWRTFSPQERKEFTEVFAEFVGNRYMERIKSEYLDIQISYLGEESMGRDKALVKTKILRQNLEVPVNYHLRVRDAGWKIYDISVEGVSMVKNYRGQINRILMNESAASLIERLRKKEEWHGEEKNL
jgi:phospholipid transport system substrate-binding protein